MIFNGKIFACILIGVFTGIFVYAIVIKYALEIYGFHLNSIQSYENQRSELQIMNSAFTSTNSNQNVTSSTSKTGSHLYEQCSATGKMPRCLNGLYCSRENICICGTKYFWNNTTCG